MRKSRGLVSVRCEMPQSTRAARPLSLCPEVRTAIGDRATCSSIQTHSPISAIRFLSTSLSPLQSIGSGTVFIFAFHKSMANGSDRNLLISESRSLFTKAQFELVGLTQ